MQPGNKIIEVARRFEGLVELKSNARWGRGRLRDADPAAKELEKMLKRAGHEDGWSYCMSFTEAVWLTAYKELCAKQETLDKIAHLLNPSVMKSWANVRNSGLNTTAPEPGAIFFMQKGSSGFGHAGIVEHVGLDFLHTIEGNTSPAPSSTEADRDGGIGTGGIWARRRAFTFKTAPGLHLVGFINPIHE